MSETVHFTFYLKIFHDLVSLSCFHVDIYANFAHMCKSIFYFAFTWLYGSKSISVKNWN